MSGWLMIVLVWAILFVFWKMLGFVFDLIDSARERR